MTINMYPTPSHAEAAFYGSLTDCDVHAMSGLWGPGDVVCIHPGGPTLIGKVAVMKSWKEILGNGGSVSMRSELLTETATETMAVHLVRQVINGRNGDAEVLATNVYKRFSDGWKIIEHHATRATLKKQKPRPSRARPAFATLQ